MKPVTLAQAGVVGGSARANVQPPTTPAFAGVTS
jgi:hypothetical protein